MTRHCDEALLPRQFPSLGGSEFLVRSEERHRGRLLPDAIRSWRPPRRRLAGTNWRKADVTDGHGYPVFAQHDRLAAAVQHGLRQTAARLVGPGNYYSIGNAVGLAMGIGLQIGSAPSEGTGIAAAADAALIYLGGNTPAMALTLATAVFFWSGEVYRRAWANGSPPNPVLNRRGDLLSGVGALPILFVRRSSASGT